MRSAGSVAIGCLFWFAPPEESSNSAPIYALARGGERKERLENGAAFAETVEQMAVAIDLSLFVFCHAALELLCESANQRFR